MHRNINEEQRHVQLADARWRAGVVRAVLEAHRASEVPRGHQWKVEEAIYLQQLEEAQSRLVFLTTPHRSQKQAPASSQAPSPRAKSTTRTIRSRLTSLFGLRRQTSQKPSHSRGRR